MAVVAFTKAGNDRKIFSQVEFTHKIY